MSLRGNILGAPGERTSLALGLASAGARLGVTPYNWRLLTSLRRHRWLLAGDGRIPRPSPVALAPSAATDADEALCRRLIAAFHAATEGRPGGSGTSGIWSWIHEARHAELAKIMDRSDSPALARELASMFRKTFVVGFAPGSLIDHRESALGGRIWRLKTLDALVSLAEALGVVPVEGPEQGETGVAFQRGLTDLVERIEGSLGVSIDFPDVGAPYGLSVEGRLVTLDSPEQIYSALRLDQALRLHLDADVAARPSIVEIGGGYGAVCLWFLRRNDALARYVIVDLPIVNVLQGYFLSRTLGHSKVSLFGEDAAQVVVTPHTALSENGGPYDAVLNKDGLPEMPEATMLEYLRWTRAKCAGIFFSSNQESTAPFRGERQGVVAEAVAKVGGFSRLRRDPSWVRTGYVEEIYAVGEGRMPGGLR